MEFPSRPATIDRAPDGDHCKNNGYDQDNLIFDRETWQINLEEMIEQSPRTAENLARVLLLLLEAIESGPEGIVQVSNSLKDGIEWAYLYTDAHRTAFRLFLLYIEGRLDIPDEPDRLIGEAVARGIETARRLTKKRRHRTKPDANASISV